MVEVSVVVPIHDPGPYFEVCMDSLLGQSLDRSQYEILLVDDGSTDDSPARLDDLAARHLHVRVSSTRRTRAGRDVPATSESTRRVCVVVSREHS